MTSGLDVLAPLAGQVLPLARVDDPVFAAELVGPGLAVVPELDGPSRVVAPIGGVVVKLHPHAFVVQGGDGRAVLVHLGINTVQLDGAGFDVRIAEGDTVEAGQHVVTWDPAAVEAGGRSSVCPVIGLDAAPGAVAPRQGDGDAVTSDDVLWHWS